MLGSYNLLAFVLASDAARAKQFYGETLGLKFITQDGYALVFEANGIQLRVTILPSHTPSEHPVLGWTVPDIAVAAADLVRAGVTIEKYSFLQQDELGIWTSPDGKAKLAWFKDPDGNVLSLLQQ